MSRGGAAVIALGAAFLVAGCGTGGIAKGGDQSKGGALFVQKCGSCHTLSAAQTKGTVGPNLDDAFSSDRRQGYKQSTIQQVVRDQIELASAPMPKNLYTGNNADAVAAYVADMTAVLANASKQIRRGGPIVIVVNDSRNLYQQILNDSGLVLEDEITRHVNRRTGRRRSRSSGR